MRSFVIAAVMTALFAGAGFLLAPAPQAADGEPRGLALTGEAASVATPSVHTFYQWTDERGTARFARALDDVPPEWRDRAGQIEVDASVFQPTRTQAVAAPSEGGHEITVYTAPWCGWCRKTLAFLDEREVEYVNKDIEADEANAEELVAKSGGRSIPFVEIDGTQIRGYNPNEMAALLE